MTPQQRLTHARAYIAELRNLAASLPDHHELAVLDLHDQVLAGVDGDSWFLGRLTRPKPGLLVDLVNGLLNLYTPLALDSPAGATTPLEARA